MLPNEGRIVVESGGNSGTAQSRNRTISENASVTTLPSIVVAKARQESPRSIGRLLQLLEVLSQATDGLSLTELALVLGMPKSSLLVLLKAMLASGHVAMRDKRYLLGHRSFDLGLRLLSARPGAEVLKDSVRELWERSQETAVLTTIDRELQVVTYQDALESPLSVRYTVKLGRTRPLYCTAAGQATLAFQNRDFINRYLAGTDLVPLTETTITDPKTLHAKLESVRQDGFAVSNAEAIRNSCGVAAPVFNADGTVDHALLIAGPLDRLGSRAAELGPILMEVARRASALLGYAD